jgi:hypothetical protein
MSSCHAEVKEFADDVHRMRDDAVGKTPAMALALAATQEWLNRYGELPSSDDWSRTHATRSGDVALKRLEFGRVAVGERCQPSQAQPTPGRLPHRPQQGCVFRLEAAEPPDLVSARAVTAAVFCLSGKERDGDGACPRPRQP